MAVRACAVGWAKARARRTFNSLMRFDRAVPTRAAWRTNGGHGAIERQHALMPRYLRAFAHPHMGHFESSTLIGWV
jgi:hypothetical protein